MSKTVDCTFARNPESPLAPAHNHNVCGWALEQTHHRWHPESVVFATRRLLTLAAAHPITACRNCDGDIEWHKAGNWEHIESGLYRCDNGTLREESTDALPCPDRLLDIAQLNVGAKGWPWAAPLLAVEILEEWGRWHDDLPTAFATLEWFVTDNEAGRGLGTAGDLLAPACAMLRQIGD